MALQILDMKAEKVGEIKLSEQLTEKVNKAVLYYAVKANRSNSRHGTSSAKERGEVNRTKKKVYKQKGTGNARHGERTANLYVGGGVSHGPRPRCYNEKVNKKFKKTSYRELFKYLIQNDGLKVLKEITFKKPSTKEAVKLLENIKVDQAVVILPQENSNAVLSFRNIKNIKVIHENNINIYDLVRYETVLLTADYFENLKARYGL